MTAKTFPEFLKQLKQQETFAFDTETNALDAIRPEMVGMSFSWERDTGWYVPIDHAKGGNLDRTKTLNALKPILENPNVGKVGHHLKYDFEVMRGCGIEMQGLAFDTLLGSYLLNPGARSLGLGKLAYQELGYDMQPISELIGDDKEQLPFGEVDPADAAKYAAEDADITWQLYEKLSANIRDLGLESVLDDIELPARAGAGPDGAARGQTGPSVPEGDERSAGEGAEEA